ncbi:hypothetical protein [Alteromonas halophila]|uniref:Pullulanase n=1 Tax=Alteromonas halophila TaxID=516698 RepID=A0A918JQT6_9ALTE|nr:hypothetical protein [Alteromonas halophila]GGW96358.1 hypothetical protein GCM10007391_33100 [Alteromonas halophila]
MIKRSILLSLFVILSGCSSSTNFPIPGVNDSPDIQFNKLYLRGVFNWWEATSSFNFQQSSTGWYVDVELIADGQPYDFRVSDANWTPAQTCGAKYPGQPVNTDSVIYIVCNPGEKNLQFTPSTTGVYRFTLTPASGDEVALVVSKQ